MGYYFYMHPSLLGKSIMLFLFAPPFVQAVLLVFNMCSNLGILVSCYFSNSRLSLEPQIRTPSLESS